jgi:hypothetical protein
MLTQINLVKLGGWAEKSKLHLAAWTHKSVQARGYKGGERSFARRVTKSSSTTNRSKLIILEE